MKLYWGPHTCAIGIHVLLEEIGRPYEHERIDVAGGATYRPEFQAINPKGKVPTIVRDDGSVLTEFSAIATWLARTNPDKHLLPADPEAEARCVEAMAYVEGTLHGQGFTRIFLPKRFKPQDFVHKTLGVGTSSVKQQGREMVERAFAVLDDALANRSWIAGDAFSVGDAALFYAERWAPQQKIHLPGQVAAHLQRMRARPSVRKVMEIWGEA